MKFISKLFCWLRYIILNDHMTGYTYVGRTVSWSWRKLLTDWTWWYSIQILDDRTHKSFNNIGWTFRLFKSFQMVIDEDQYCTILYCIIFYIPYARRFVCMVMTKKDCFTLSFECACADSNMIELLNKVGQTGPDWRSSESERMLCCLCTLSWKPRRRICLMIREILLHCNFVVDERCEVRRLARCAGLRGAQAC